MIRPLNYVSRGTDPVIAAILGKLNEPVEVSSLDELRSLLETRSDQPVTEPRTLDLLGHSTRGARMLRIGDAVIDMFDAKVERFFTELGDSMLLHELGIVALRLLGCSTATQPCGQRTIMRLARALRMPVFGARKNLMRSHYDEHGLRPEFAHVLVDSASLPNPTLGLG